jgi:hypothetical protein
LERSVLASWAQTEVANAIISRNNCRAELARRHLGDLSRFVPVTLLLLRKFIRPMPMVA